MGEDRLVRLTIAAVVMAGLGCALASPASAQSLSDRFKSLYGGKSDEPAEGAPPPGAAPKSQVPEDLFCPPVSIRAGASTYAVGPPGKQAVGNDLRYQATITKTARECTINAGQITARIGVQGPVVADDLVYPAPTGAAGDSYVFYIGFDPQALKPEPKPKAPKKK